MVRVISGWIAIVAVLVAVHAGPAGAVEQYTWRDLGTLGGLSSGAYDINNAGEVVGWAVIVTQGPVPIYARRGDHPPFRWEVVGYEEGLVQRHNAFLYCYRQDQMVSLGDATQWSQAYGINDHGQVVGAVYLGGKRMAFVAGKGFLWELGTLGGSIPGSIANDINNDGLIVGNTYDATGHVWFRASYDNLHMEKIEPLPGIPAQVRAVNTGGQIAGNCVLQPDQLMVSRAVLYENGLGYDLGTFDGGTESHAWDINDSGDVVGLSYHTAMSTSQTAFLYSNGEMTDLGTLKPNDISEAYGINNHGQIVGRSGHAAFLYENGQMYDLNDLVPEPIDGWCLFRARAINDHGQIVGLACDLNDPWTEGHAFLLTPVGGVNIEADLIDLAASKSSMAVRIPEPSTLALLAAGMLGVGWWLRRTASRGGCSTGTWASSSCRLLSRSPP